MLILGIQGMFFRAVLMNGSAKYRRLIENGHTVIGLLPVMVCNDLNGSCSIFEGLSYVDWYTCTGEVHAKKAQRLSAQWRSRGKESALLHDAMMENVMPLAMLGLLVFRWME